MYNSAADRDSTIEPIINGTEGEKRAAIRESETELRRMIDAISTFVHVLGPDGSVLYANQTVLDYLGITLDEVRREDYRTRYFHPEDVERLREERAKALAGGVPFENEQRALGKDGQCRWFLVRYNPFFDEQGKVLRWSRRDRPLFHVRRDCWRFRRSSQRAVAGRKSCSNRIHGPDYR